MKMPVFTPCGDTQSFTFLGPEDPIQFQIPRGMTLVRVKIDGGETVWFDINRNATVAASMPLVPNQWELIAIPPAGFISFCSQGTPKISATFGVGS